MEKESNPSDFATSAAQGQKANTHTHTHSRPVLLGVLVRLHECLCGFDWDGEPGVNVGRFPLTYGGFISPHIHIGLILSRSQASENPGS